MPAPSAAPKIVWKPNEWEAIARALHDAHPELDLLATSDFSHVRFTDVVKIQEAVLPADRQRPIDDMWKVKKGLTAAYSRMRERANPPAVPDYTAALNDPPVILTDDNAPHEEDQHETAAQAARRANIQWTPAEWYAIAAEIHRRNPFAKYPDSTTLAGLRLVDVKEAMRVLPRERHRSGLVTVTPCRPYLLDAFKIVKEDLLADALRKQEAKQRAEDERKRIESENAKEALAEAQARIAELTAAMQKTMTLEHLLGQVGAQLAAPFADGFINTFIDKFRAAIAKDIPGMLPTTVADTAAPADPPELVAITPPPVKPVKPAEPVKPPHILIVGPLPQQAREIEKCYPQVRFTIHSGHSANIRDLAKSCDRAIGMTRFLSHAIDGILAKTAGDRYTRVAHGVSDIKRQLDVWMHTGVIPANPERLVA